VKKPTEVPPWFAPGTTLEQYTNMLAIAPSLGLNTESHLATLRAQMNIPGFYISLALGCAWDGYIRTNYPGFKVQAPPPRNIAQEERAKALMRAYEVEQAEARKNPQPRTMQEAQMFYGSDREALNGWAQQYARENGLL